MKAHTVSLYEPLQGTAVSLKGTTHPVIVTIRDHRGHNGILLYSYCTPLLQVGGLSNVSHTAVPRHKVKWRAKQHRPLRT